MQQQCFQFIPRADAGSPDPPRGICPQAKARAAHVGESFAVEPMIPRLRAG